MDTILTAANVKETIYNQDINLNRSLLLQIPELTSTYDNIPLQEVIKILDYLKDPIIVLRRRFSNGVVSEDFKLVAISSVRGDRNCFDTTVGYEGVDSKILDSQRTFYADMIRGGRYDIGSTTEGELYTFIGRFTNVINSGYTISNIPFMYDISRLEEIKKKLLKSVNQSGEV